MCDFTTGFVKPEMVKVRHVVVISPRSRDRSGLCLVVPFSCQAPNPVMPFHYQIPADKYPFFSPGEAVWAKADMVTSVSHQRLDRVCVNGRYDSPLLEESDFVAIQNAVLQAMGLGHFVVAMVPVAP